MKSLRDSGSAVPRSVPALFSRGSLRRLVPLAALLAAGAALANAPASALQLTSRVGFQFGEAKPLAADSKGDNLSLLGQIRANSNTPLTVLLSGPETGDAQLLVTVKNGFQTTTYTRPAHLTGTPQTIRLTLSRQATATDNYHNGIKITVQALQNGRSLAQQEMMYSANKPAATFNLLALTGRHDDLKFLREGGVRPTLRHTANESAVTSVPFLLNAAPESLPDSAQAYDAIDAVVLDSDYPFPAASPEQQEALREYVRQGGRLIIVTTDAIPFWCSNFRDSFGKAGWKSYAFTPEIDIKTKLYGAGILFTELVGPPENDSTTRNYRQEWNYLLGGTDLPLFSPKQALSAAMQVENGSDMTDALAGQQAAQTVPFPLVAAFLLAYIVLIIPVNYLVLKKLDRRELAWVTAPALVFLFSGASYAVANAIKGGKLTVNRAVIYEAFANTDTATGYGQFTLYSPRRASYDISLGDPNDAANPYRNIEPTETKRSANSSLTDITVARDASTTLKNVSIPIYDTRSFNLPVTGSLGGGLEARITMLNKTTMRYLLTNHTKYYLHGCYVIVGDQTVQVSDIKAGESAQATAAWSGNATSVNNFILPYNSSSAYTNEREGFGLNQREESTEHLHAGIREAMRYALIPNYYPYGENGTYARTSQPTRTVCGFIGWFDAKTLDVRIDGKPTAGEQENLLYVHLPLPSKGNHRSAYTGNSPLQWIPDADSAAKNANTTQEKTDAK